jgi:hypothetical protein
MEKEVTPMKSVTKAKKLRKKNKKRRMDPNVMERSNRI